jgi:hypothetical protein
MEIQHKASLHFFLYAPVCVSLLQNQLLSKTHIISHVKNIAALSHCPLPLTSDYELYHSEIRRV